MERSPALGYEKHCRVEASAVPGDAWGNVSERNNSQLVARRAGLQTGPYREVCVANVASLPKGVCVDVSMDDRGSKFVLALKAC